MLQGTGSIVVRKEVLAECGEKGVWPLGRMPLINGFRALLGTLGYRDRGR
jgi:hypothetical protein